MFFAYIFFPIVARIFPNWRPPTWAADYDYGKWHRWVGFVFMLFDVAVIIGLITLWAWSHR